MRRSIAVLIALAGVAPLGLAAQDPGFPSGAKHVAVESTTLILDSSRVSRLGLEGLAISGGESAAGVAPRCHAGQVRAGTRVGGLEVAAFLDLVQRERAVRQESTQRTVTLSGSAARVTSQRTLVGPYGQMASAGPALWVEPVAREDGQVSLRVWTATGEVRSGPFGSVWADVPVEARTEITVPSGTPVVIAATEQGTESTHRGLLGRGSDESSTRSWVIVRPRVVGNPAEAFQMPEGISREWIKP